MPAMVRGLPRALPVCIVERKEDIIGTGVVLALETL